MSQSTVSSLPMPPMSIRLMQDDDERLLQTGADLARLMYGYGLRADDPMLDIGSCYGRLPLGLLSATDYRGSYLGFDVLKKQVQWCRTALTPVAPNFTFKHLDIRNDRYNPRGTMEPTTVRFPVASASVRWISLFSIFTHFYQADIERYLREMRRVLKPGGRAVTTWFVYDQARLPLIVSEQASYPMVHRLGQSARYCEPADPLRAIAFEADLVRSMVAAAGLRIERIDRGTWCGEPGTIFQDVVVLRRSGSLLERGKLVAGRAKRQVVRSLRGRRL
jgi:SAM-dependent methyltransferase